MKKCFKIILSIFVLALTFVVGFQTANLRNEGKWKLEQKNNQSGIDLKLPGENEKNRQCGNTDGSKGEVGIASR